MTDGAADRPVRGMLRLAAFPALLAAATYANTLWNGFVYDDSWTLKNVSEFMQAPSSRMFLTGRGLTYAVHLLDLSLWGMWAPGFHLTNLVLHALASVLAALLGVAVSRSRPAGLICGLVFAVHPVHVEAVASIAYRKDVLAMVFVSLATLFWLGSRGSVARFLLAYVCYGLGVFAKDMAALGLPVMFFLGDVLFGPEEGLRPRLRRAGRRAAFPLSAMALATIVAVRNFAPAAMNDIWLESSGRIGGYPEVLASSLSVVPEAGRLLLWPVTLSADYPLRAPSGVLSSPPILGAALLIGCGLLSLALARRAPAASFALAWTLVMYLPVSNVAPLTHFFLQERYLYTPSFGFCLLVGLLLAPRESSRARSGPARGKTPDERSGLARFKLAILVVLLVAGAARCALRNRDWRDDYTLWSSALAAGVETARVHHGLATEYVRQAKPELSIPHYRRAAELQPGPGSFTRLAKAFFLVGRLDEAEKLCRYVLARQADDADARWLLETIAKQRNGAGPPAAPAEQSAHDRAP